MSWGTVVRDEQHLQALPQVGCLLQGLPGLAARLVDVLVGDAGGGVDRVHDDVGPLGGDEPVEEVLGGRRLGERLDQAFDDSTAPPGILEDLRVAAVLEIGEGEDVAPGGEDLYLPALRLEGGRRLLRFLPREGEKGQPARGLTQEAARHRVADETVPSEDRGRSCPGCPRPRRIPWNGRRDLTRARRTGDAKRITRSGAQAKGLRTTTPGCTRPGWRSSDQTTPQPSCSALLTMSASQKARRLRRWISMASRTSSGRGE